MHVRLIPLQEGDPIEIDKDLILLGRNEICDVQLGHKSISKLHCVLVKTDGLLLVRDLGSTNGTRVNGARVRRGALLPDDQLKIASLTYRVEFTKSKPKTVSPEEFTQRLDAGEVEELLKRIGTEKMTDGQEIIDPSLPVVQANSLPDLYEDDEPEPEKT